MPQTKSFSPQVSLFTSTEETWKQVSCCLSHGFRPVTRLFCARPLPSVWAMSVDDCPLQVCVCVYCVPGGYLIPPAVLAPNRLFLLSKPLRPLSRLSAGRHYQIPLLLPSFSSRFPGLFSHRFYLTSPPPSLSPHSPLSSQSPLLSITEDVHLS